MIKERKQKRMESREEIKIPHQVNSQAIPSTFKLFKKVPDEFYESKDFGTTSKMDKISEVDSSSMISDIDAKSKLAPEIN